MLQPLRQGEPSMSGATPERAGGMSPDGPRLAGEVPRGSQDENVEMNQAGSSSAGPAP